MKKIRMFLAFLVATFLLLGTGFIANAASPGEGKAQGKKDDAGPGKSMRREYVPGELIVKFKKGTGRGEKAVSRNRRGAEKIREFVHQNAELVKLGPGTTVEAAIAAYNADPDVEFAEPNYLFHTSEVVPNDPLFNGLWGLRNTGQTGGAAGADISATDAWGVTIGDGSVIVAVLDTGVDYTHPDLAGNMWVNAQEIPGNGIDDDGNGYVDDVYGIDAYNHDSNPMDDNGHGTHCSGTIGASGNNGLGVAGVNWNVRILPCKFLSSGGSGPLSAALECIEYVKDLKDRGENIIASSNSWGCIGCNSQGLSDAIRGHMDSGMLFIAAAGNANCDNDADSESRRNYPSSFDVPNVIAVAATDNADARAWFSCYGRRSVHVGAPGVNILSTMPPNAYLSSTCNDADGDGYGTCSGTSMATPHVAGLAALVKAGDPSGNWAGIRNLIFAGGDLIQSMNNVTVTGSRINAYGSLTCSQKPLFSALKFTKYTEGYQVGVPVTLSAMSIDCKDPVGPVTVASSAGSATLHDDGSPPDAAAHDGIFTGTLTPTGPIDLLTFSSPAGSETIVLRHSGLMITTGSLPNASQGVHYSQSVTAEGGVTPYAWSLDAGSLPPGLSLASSGVISGVPSASGAYGFTVKVTDSSGVAVTQQLSIVVLAPSPLTITTASLPNAKFGTSYNQGMTASGGLTPYVWSLALGSLPPGLRLNADSGGISGYPTATGTYGFTAQVTDRSGATDAKALSITVTADPLTITTSSLSNGKVGSHYSQYIYASGGTGWYTWSLASGSLPPDLGVYTRDVDGRIAGTPRATGTYNFTIRVTDRENNTATKAFSISITANPLSIYSPDSLPDGTVGRYYAQELLAYGGVPPYTWSLASGSLPPGLSVNPTTGWIQGNPSATGTYNFTIRVTDHENNTATRAYTIVTTANPLSIYSPDSLPNGTVGRSYAQQILAYGGVPPYTWSLASGSLPPGLSVNQTTGWIQGNPSATGTYNFTIRVTDHENNTATKEFSIVVN